MPGLIFCPCPALLMTHSCHWDVSPVSATTVSFSGVWDRSPGSAGLLKQSGFCRMFYVLIFFALCFFFIPFCFYYYYSFNIFSHVLNFLVSPVKQFVTLVLKEQNRNISLILILSVLLLCKPVRLQFIGWLAALYYTTHANISFLFSRRSFLLLFSLSGVKCSETQRLRVSHRMWSHPQSDSKNRPMGNEMCWYCFNTWGHIYHK